MVTFINAVTGTVMYVHESRADEYIRMGHIPVTPPEEATDLSDQACEEQKAKRAASKAKK